MEVLIKRFSISIFILIMICLSGPAYSADNLNLQEQEIKAGLLYNFLKYTEWPAGGINDSSQLSLCIFGKDPFAGYLRPMDGKTVRQRKISVININEVSAVADCQLLFINSEEKSHWHELSGFLKGKPILTVGDFSGFANSGGMIEFSRKDAHVIAKFNMDASHQAGLRVQERLLKLVTIVSSPTGKAS